MTSISEQPTCSTVPTIADVAGHATRFTDHSVADPGIRTLLSADAQWQAWLDVEAALAQAQAEIGMIPAEAADAIALAARVELLDAAAVNRGIAATSHPLLPLIGELARNAGAAAGEYVHWGATTQNITQTGNNLLIRAAYEKVSELLADCLLAAGRLAKNEAESPMAGRTHGQHAVPITLGFKAAIWVEELVADSERIQVAAEGMRTAMMGGAVGSYASFGPDGPEVERRTAARLGLRPAAIPSRAMLEPFAEHVWALAMLAASGARIARDVMTMMQTETAEVSEPRGDGSVGSSTMPQKQNPKLTYDIVELCARIRALVPVTLEARIHSFEADGSSTALMDEAAFEALVLVGDLLIRLRQVLGGLVIDRDRMRSNLDLTQGLISAEAVMLRLAVAVGRQTAHDIVLELSAQAALEGRSLAEVLAEDARISGHIPADELASVIDPKRHLGLCSDIARAAGVRAVAAAEQLNPSSHIHRPAAPEEE